MVPAGLCRRVNLDRGQRPARREPKTVATPVEEPWVGDELTMCLVRGDGPFEAQVFLVGDPE